MNMRKLNRDFQGFKRTIDTFRIKSDSRTENEASLEFADVLPNIQKINGIIIRTENKMTGDFEQLFRGNRPGFT